VIGTQVTENLFPQVFLPIEFTCHAWQQAKFDRSAGITPPRKPLATIHTYRRNAGSFADRHCGRREYGASRMRPAGSPVDSPFWFANSFARLVNLIILQIV
jgi:hypothetical protein